MVLTKMVMVVTKQKKKLNKINKKRNASQF
jgi:hypothetical protein